MQSKLRRDFENCGESRLADEGDGDAVRSVTMKPMCLHHSQNHL